MDNINLIIWDLDGTKYKFHDDIHNIANHLLVDIVNERLVAQGLALLPDDEIVSLGEKSYDKSGISWKIFTQIYNIDPHDLFQAFNMKMPLFTVDSIASAAYKEKINLTKARGVDHIIFTHGSRAWAKKVLDKLGLAQEFNDNKIFDISHVGWVLKHEGKQSYLRLKDLFNFEPQCTVMVEDTPKCLMGAKALGMKTVLIDRKNIYNINKLPDYVDCIFQCPEAFLDFFIA